jgi:hypothetical protein
MLPVVDTSGAVVVDTSPAANTQTVVPETNSGTPPAVTPKGPDNVAIYQDIVAKHNENPAYQMTDAETDVFLEVQDLINSKAIKQPEPKKLISKESKPEVKDEPKPEVKDEPPAQSDKDNSPKEDSVTASMLESMKKVGAKDVTELPKKIESLIRNRDESGGKLGSENAGLKAKLAALEAEKANHVAWLNLLQKGDPKAIEFLHKNVGYNPSAPTATKPIAGENPPKGLDDLGEIDDESILDTELAKQVRALKKIIKDQGEILNSVTQKDKAREEERLTERANASYVDDIVNLVTSDENQKYYGLSAKEARGLAEFYFSPGQKENPIHPKFQKVHELISFAYENHFPTLEAAHIVHFHKSGAFAQKIVDATKNGQQKFTPSVNSENSDKQSREGNNVPDPTVTDESITRMEQGDFESIPDNWMDVHGNLDPKKVPKRFHERAFGRAKPI